MPRAEDLPHVRAATARATNGPADESGDPGGSHVVRTAAASHHAGAVDVAAAPLAQPSPARAPILEVDLDTLVEKVQRKLLRSLASERERRGGFG